MSVREIPVYGFDIETDTSTNGLDPRVSRVTSFAIWSLTEKHCVADADERELLCELARLVDRLPGGIMAGWNSAVFDLPFLATRAGLLGISLPFTLIPDPAITPKYDFTPPHTCGYRAYVGEHVHADIAYAYKLDAHRLGVSWSLKPVARAFGVQMVEVDRERMQELSADELAAYNLSDARGTCLLARGLGDRLAGWLDSHRIRELEEMQKS